MGNARVSDRRSKAPVGEEDEGEAVMNWSCHDEKLLKEVVHRFRPKLVINLTAACACFQSLLVSRKVPCIALCSLASRPCSRFRF